MLSAIVLYESAPRPARIDPAESLVRTLGSLVKASVEGLLGDVAIAGPSDLGLGLIADHAGCGLIEAADERQWLHGAIEAARGPDLLLLRSGFAPEAGFIEEATDFLRESSARQTAGGHAAILRAAPASFLERLFPRLAPLAGLIAPRERCLDLGAPEGLAALAHSVAPARALRTHARRIG